MTNKEYYQELGLYQTMLQMKEHLDDSGIYCPIKAVTGEHRDCKLIKTRSGYTQFRDCEGCILAWLSENVSDEPTNSQGKKEDVAPELTILLNALTLLLGMHEMAQDPEIAIPENIKFCIDTGYTLVEQFRKLKHD